MSFEKKVNASLQKVFGERVKASEKDGVITLTGNVENWQEVFEAGKMSADKKKRYYLVNKIRCKEEVPAMSIPPVFDDSLEGRKCDVAIIGAGVVGCAIARELAKYKLDIVLIEKEHDVAMQASARNDGMVHPGIDLRKGSEKQRYNSAGNAMYDQICKELGVPFQRVGQYLCFTASWAKYLLPMATGYWKSMNVPCKFLNKQELFEKEPHLNPAITCALWFPTAGIVCPYGLTIAYAENAVDNGVTLSLDTAVLDMEVQHGNITSVKTNRGTIYPHLVINAAGVFSDEVANLAQDQFFSIHPRKGTNAILDKKAAEQVHTIASTIGTASTKTTHSKGGGIVSTVDGNLLIGPDAVETPNREDYATERKSIEATFAKQSKASPQLSTGDIITYFTGVRAPTYEEDFVICRGRATKNIIHAAGIQSPGLTAAPAIGVEVSKMAVSVLGEFRKVETNKKFNPVRIPIPRTAEMSLQERDLLIRARPDYGVITCRCEEISKGEIIDALNRSVPCDTVDGVKRRVRPGMGRCQGGFCGPLVTQIIAEQKHTRLNEVLKSGYGSNLVYGQTKEGVTV